MLPGPGDPIDAALVRATARRKLFGEAAPMPRIGRFVVERRLGSGAMGVVYAARDPELDRTVAIKVLHAADDGAETARLQREAQTLAKLRHPNLIAAHELGTWEGRLFLAMEYVEGVTLRAWRQESPRSWRAVLAVLLAAGRGLAAAHRAGIVHRDFKPDNVLVGGDDVRVVDFGLAHREAGAAAVGFAGTPAYAAPECLLGGAADARSDQYAFCVTLEEALRGGRGPAATGRVPARIRRVLARGLSPDPEKRFASMDDLLVALARDPGKAIQRGLAAVALVAVAAAATYGITHEPATDPCGGGEARLDGVWDDRARAAVAEAFRRSGSPHAEPAHALVAAELDRYTGDWVSAHREACRATRVTGEQSAELLDRRMACLSQRLQVAAELVTVLGGADAAMVRTSPAAVHALPDLRACADLIALRDRVPPPVDPVTAARVRELDEQIARGWAMRAAGDIAGARGLAKEIVDEARPLGHAPVLAEALHLRASLGTLDPVPTETLWREVALAAAEAHDDRLLATAWLERMTLVGYGMARHSEALAMQPFAEAAVARAGHDPVLAALLHNRVGIILDEMGRHAEARAGFREALALREQVYGPDHPEVAAILNNLGDSYSLEGRHAEARPYLERALAIHQRALGEFHPFTSFSSQNLGAVLLELGELDEARRLTERAIAFYRDMYPEPPPVPLSTLALIDLRQGRPDEALAHLEQAADGVRRSKPGHPEDAIVELRRGLVLRELGRREDAIVHLERALAIREQVFAPDHPAIAEARAELAATR